MKPNTPTKQHSKEPNSSGIVKSMNMIELETPQNTEKHIAPKLPAPIPFFITEYGHTFRNTPCYQLRMESPIGCVQYVISGSGIILCNDQMYSVSEGDTFLLPEGSNHIYYSNPDHQFERIWFNYKGTLASELLSLYGLNDIIVFRQTDTHRHLTDICQSFTAFTEPLTCHNEAACSFLRLVQFLFLHKPPVSENTTGLESIRQFIDCHITDNLKISHIAEHFSFTQEHIIRIFKKTYGITPHQYILQSKIRLGMIMLKAGTHTIEEISEKLNFSDPHHFSVQFKKLTGYSPSSYRKSS